jgi:hypothetical protein
MSAQRQDHLQAARATVIGHVQNASHHHCHGCFSLFISSFSIQRFFLCQLVSDSARVAAESRR